MRWISTRAQGAAEVAALTQELEQLKQENMRLRLARQSPLSIGRVADSARDLPAAVVQPRSSEDGAETLDEARHLLAQAETTRSAVLDVVRSLQIAAAQLERQLVASASSMEVDRRVVERRSSSV